MDFRRYDKTRDEDSVLRIAREIGWLRDADEHREAWRLSLASSLSLVADVHGEAECLAMSVAGRIRHGERDLPLAVVTAVATSRVARQQGLATRLTAETLAADVLDRGARVAILGIFDQGFYDRLGFGAGPYDPQLSFDPADLDVGGLSPRTPVRLGMDDAERVHRARHARRRPHGSIVLDPPELTRSEMLALQKGFGLGYEDPDSDELTHHLWCVPVKVGSGPYRVAWATFRTRDQLLELLALLRGLSDQVKLVRMLEPPGVQLQDFLRRPIRSRQLTRKGDFEVRTNALSWWQVRILDLPGCLAETRLAAPETVRFNLELSDPLPDRLSDATRARWSGVGGDYLVTLGPECHAERRAADAALPTMRTSVNTLTRLWLGVRPPTGLGLSSPDLEAPADLLAALDRVLALPTPLPDWDI